MEFSGSVKFGFGDFIRRGRCPHRPLPRSEERADVGIGPYGSTNPDLRLHRITRQASIRRSRDQLALAGLVEGSTAAGRPVTGSV